MEVVFACGLKLVSQKNSLTERVLWNACVCRLFVCVCVMVGEAVVEADFQEYLAGW